MDKIYIKDLEVYAFHGVNQQEKDMGQKFLISLEIFMDLKEAGQSDDINKTVSYADICSVIHEEFQKHKYNLIEKAAEETAELILLKYDRIKGVKVLIKKPWAPIGKALEYAAVEIERFWHTAYVALGSNKGNKEENLINAIKEIDNSRQTKVTKTSNFYITKPVGYLEQDDFLNAAIEIKTLLTPEELIQFLLNVEKEFKRERIIKWGPRTLDLDVILYDDIVTTNENIIIPHPRMQEREFVLKPLSDIAPYKVHPLLNKRIITLLEGLEG